MVRFLARAVRESETLEYLQRPALQPVRLAVEHFRAAFIYDTGVDPAVGHPGCAHETVVYISMYCNSKRGKKESHPAGPAPTMML